MFITYIEWMNYFYKNAQLEKWTKVPTTTCSLLLLSFFPPPFFHYCIHKCTQKRFPTYLKVSIKFTLQVHCLMLSRMRFHIQNALWVKWTQEWETKEIVIASVNNLNGNCYVAYNYRNLEMKIFLLLVLCYGTFFSQLTFHSAI